MLQKHFVIIGASAAGISVVNRLARLLPEARITCISAEKELPYNKCLLADYSAGLKQEEDIQLHIAPSPTISLLLDTRVSTINAIHKKIITHAGQEIAYDALFLGMGSSPSIPAALQYTWYEGMFTFHNLVYANKMLAYIAQKKVQNAVIIGAGLSGVECADVLQKAGIAVTLVERSERLLPHFLDKTASDLLKCAIEERHGTVYCATSVVKVEGANDRISKVHLSTGQSITTNLLIIATGLRPNLDLAHTAGILTTQEGVIVDEYMQTSIPGIYAGGDLISVCNVLTGTSMTSCTWPDAMLHGIHAAQAMAEQPIKPYNGAAIITSSSFYDYYMAQAGLLEPQLPEHTLIIQAKNGSYGRYIMQDSTLKGFSVLGTTHNVGVLRRALLTGQPFDLD